MRPYHHSFQAKALLSWIASRNCQANKSDYYQINSILPISWGLIPAQNLMEAPLVYFNQGITTTDWINGRLKEEFQSVYYHWDQARKAGSWTEKHLGIRWARCQKGINFSYKWTPGWYHWLRKFYFSTVWEFKVFSVVRCLGVEKSWRYSQWYYNPVQYSLLLGRNLSIYQNLWSGCLIG